MPYDSPMKKKGSSCMQMKDHKGKPSGLMMEGSAMHMSMLHQEKTKKVEEAKAKKLDKKQEIKEKKDLLEYMPVDDKASAMEMSPYKMDHGSPAEFTGMSGGSALHTNHDKDERSGKGKSMTEGIELGEATASLSDMYKRDAEMKLPAFPEFTKTAGGDMQVKSGSGGVEAFPSSAYIGKGTSKPGVGRVFSEEQISAGRKKYEKLAKRKKKAQDYLAANM